MEQVRNENPDDVLRKYQEKRAARKLHKDRAADAPEPLEPSQSQEVRHFKKDDQNKCIYCLRSPLSVPSLPRRALQQPVWNATASAANERRKMHKLNGQTRYA